MSTNLRLLTIDSSGVDLSALDGAGCESVDGSRVEVVSQTRIFYGSREGHERLLSYSFYMVCGEELSHNLLCNF